MWIRLGNLTGQGCVHDEHFPSHGEECHHPDGAFWEIFERSSCCPPPSHLPGLQRGPLDPWVSPLPSAVFTKQWVGS